MKKKWFFLGVAAVFLLSASQAFATKMYVEWCPMSGVDGYKVYYGTASRVYGPPWDNGIATNYTSDPLPEGVYFVAVSAYTGSDESPLSDEKVLVLVENGESSSGWSVVRGVMPVAGYDPVDSGSALFFSGVTNSTMAASSKISLANVPVELATTRFLFNFRATGSGGVVSIYLTTKSKGAVMLSYRQQDTNSFGTTTAIFGIGSSMKDGQIHLVERDLDDDLITSGISTTGNDILSYNTLLVYSYYNNSFELRGVGFSQKFGTCP